jgi:hypothetical protein
VLHEKALVPPLRVAETLELSDRPQIELRHLPDKIAIGHLLSPAREHERMDGKRSSDVPDQDAWLLGQLDSSELELELVFMDSPWA